jgi:hypothetical protein
MKVMIAIFTVLAVVVGLCAIPVGAQGLPWPHVFYGTVEINGNPAPIGTMIEARGEGVVTGEGNPITVTEAGMYGGPDPSDPKLLVQGDIEEGTILTFYVNGEAADQIAEWHSGAITEFDLSAIITTPPDEEVGEEAPQDTIAPRISDVSFCPEGVTDTTADICWITSERSTSQVEYWTSSSMLSPPDEILVTEHHVHLSGLTPGTTYHYRTMSKDEVSNLAVSDVYTFTTLEKPQVSPTLSPAPPTPPTMPSEVKPTLNWPVIGGIIAGVVIVGLLIFLLVRRRAY